MLTAKQLGRQLILVLILGLLSITTFNIITSYYSTKGTLQKDILAKLHAIPRTTSLEIDGDMHESLINDHPVIDSLKIVTCKEYSRINNTLTDVYTLFIEEGDSTVGRADSLRMGVVSGQKFYFRNTYDSHPDELLNNFNTGGIVTEYEDKYGMWLSAFSPIENSAGQTVAVVQVDQRVDDFLDRVWQEAVRNAIISFLIITVIAIIMIFFIQKMVASDKKKTETIERTSNMLKAQNLKITNSINYAQRIQDSIIPKECELKKYFEKSFIYFIPKDTVSGDFPWVYKSPSTINFAAVDCTGHGVPGAMVSFVGYFLLRKIIEMSPDDQSNLLIDKLHKEVTTTLQQDKNSDHNNDGMDAAFCKVDKEQLTLCFSGAHRPLYLVRKGELKEYKGAKRGVGGIQYDDTNREFEGHSIQLEKGDRIFIFSDGYADQFGGPKNKKIGPKRLRATLSLDLPMSEIKQKLDTEFYSWKGDIDQTNDVLIIGVEI